MRVCAHVRVHSSLKHPEEPPAQGPEPSPSPGVPGAARPHGAEGRKCMEVTEPRVDFIRPNAGDRTFFRRTVSFCVAKLKASVTKPYELREAPGRDLLRPEVQNAVCTVGRPFQALAAFPAHLSECRDCCRVSQNGVAACWNVREATPATPASAEVSVTEVTAVS